MLDLNICVGSSCHLKGSHNIIQELLRIIEAENLHDLVTVKATFCMKQCRDGVSVSVGDKTHSIMPGMCRAFFTEHVLPRLPEKAEDSTGEKKPTKKRRSSKLRICPTTS